MKIKPPLTKRQFCVASGVLAIPFNVLVGEQMKISYTVYDEDGNIILGGVCEFLDLADIQWQAFDNGHAVFTEMMDDE